MSFKRGSFVKIKSGDYKGKTGQVVRRTEEGELVILVDLDGDPLTPPIEVKIPAKFARAMRIINWVVSILLPLLYGIKRK